MKDHAVNKSILAVAAILVAASMAFGKFPGFDIGHSSNKAKNIQLFETGQIPGGPTLQSGDYRVVLNDNSKKPEVSFYQDGKLVAQVPAKLVDESKKFEQTEIHFDARSATPKITEMDLGGWKVEILFGQNNSGAGSGK